MAVGCGRASVGSRGTRTAEITGASASSWRRGGRWLDWGSARGRTLRPKSLLDQQTMKCVRATHVFRINLKKQGLPLLEREWKVVTKSRTLWNPCLGVQELTIN